MIDTSRVQAVRISIEVSPSTTTQGGLTLAIPITLPQSHPPLQAVRPPLGFLAGVAMGGAIVGSAVTTLGHNVFGHVPTEIVRAILLTPVALLAGLS